MTKEIPVSQVEEAMYHIQQKHDPWNAQGELETTETVDVEKLRAATRTACSAHPILGATLQPASLTDTEYVWEVPENGEASDIEFSIEVYEPGEIDLEAARNRAYFEPFDLETEPPVRMLVLREAGIDGGDRLMISLNHTAVDGAGSLQFTWTVTQAYRGEDPSESPVSFEESRSWLDDLGPASVSDGLDVINDGITVVDRLVRELTKTVDEPARIARDRDPNDPDWGYRFTRRELDETLTTKVVGDRPPDVSVNDVFLAGQQLAIEQWNEEHGDRPGKISTMMPVNLRPPEHFYDVAGNYSLFESIQTRRKHRRDPLEAVREVADQTSKLKQREQAASLLKLLRMVPDTLPVGLKREAPELLRGPGQRVCDTTCLTNLGKVPVMPSLAGPDGTERTWFTPTVWQGTSVGVAVATYGGKVTFNFRHRRAVLGADAAERFSDRFMDGIETTIEAL